MGDEAELRLWLTSGGEPFVFRMSNEAAEGTYAVLTAAWEHAPPTGTVGFRDGTTIPIAAVVAVRLTLAPRDPHPTGGWVAN